MALSLLYTYICYTLLLPFKKLVLVLMITKAWRNSSMAKQPIKSCVSNQSRTCGKACAKHQNKFESPRRNFNVFLENKEFYLILRFCSSFCLFRAFGFPWLCYSFQVSFDADFSVFSWLISRFYHWIRRNLPVGRHFGYCFHSRPCFLIDISSRTIYRNFEMLFSCLSNFLLLFQECSVVNTLGSIACLGLFSPGGIVSTTRRRF